MKNILKRFWFRAEFIFYPAWERRCYDSALVVLFITRSFILEQQQKKWTSTFCRCYYRLSFYRCDGFLLPLLLSIVFFLSLVWFCGVPEIASTLTTETGSKPATKMTCNRDTHEWFVFSTWLDVCCVFHCSILSIRTTQCRTDAICREQEQKKN